jgi:hypothetical protein
MNEKIYTRGLTGEGPKKRAGMNTTKVLPSRLEYRVSGGRENAKSARKNTETTDTVVYYKRTLRSAAAAMAIIWLEEPACGGHQLGTKLEMRYFRCPLVLRRIRYSTEMGRNKGPEG